MTPQSAFLIAAKITPGRESGLRALLQSMNTQPGLANPDNPLLPFGHINTLHVARFTVLRANTNDDISHYGVSPRPWHSSLVFLGDVDGDPDLVLAELCVRAGPGLAEIFSHCENFNPLSDNLLSWLRDHKLNASANYVNWRGRTVVQIHEEQALARFVRDWIAGEGNELPESPRELHSKLRQALSEEVADLRLSLTPDAPTPAIWYLKNTLHLIGIPALGFLLLPLVILLMPLYLWRLRQLEKSDPVYNPRPSAEHVQQLTEVEDIDITNHFNVFGQVKPGPLRRLSIKTFLLLLDYACRHIYHRGYLARVQTIHFARWVMLDNDSRVYFASNYDGSADSYMDDFINKVAWGLNLVFSNGVGYPPTRFLLKDGAKIEGMYKNTLRRNQLASECWYKAYPGLSAVDLARHQKIREGLMRQNPSDSELSAWLSCL